MFSVCSHTPRRRRRSSQWHALPARESTPTNTACSEVNSCSAMFTRKVMLAGSGSGARLTWARVEARGVGVVHVVERGDAVAAVVAARALHVLLVAVPRVAVDELEFVGAWRHFQRHAPVPSPLSIKGVPAGSQPWNEPAKCTPSGETLDTTLMSAVNVTTKGATHVSHALKQYAPPVASAASRCSHCQASTHGCQTRCHMRRQSTRWDLPRCCR